MSSTDVETFNGKIVYNLDGSSAYIIDADSANDNGNGETSKFRQATASISVKKNFSNANDIGFVEAKEKKEQQEQEQHQKQEQEQETLYKTSPRIHSFRVVTAQDANSNPTRDIIFKIQKPILMCFICKLSFGNVKSFSLHANTEHKLNLIELEQQLLKREYSSAIIQRNMDEKPSISFLQPLDINTAGDVADEKNLQQISTDAVGPIPPKTDKQEKENENDNHDQCREREPQNDSENDHESDHVSNNQMAAPSAYYHHQVKSSMKFGSLNSVTETTKTNKLSKVSVPSSSSSTSSGEVSSLSRTDNLSNNINNKSEESSLEVEMNPGSSLSPQRNELSEVPSSDFLAATAPGVFPPQVSSFHASLAALAANNTESNGNRVKLITEFLQQQLQQHQQSQQQHQSSLFPSQCLEHPDFNGVDCKTCEFLEIQGRTKSPSLPQLQVPPLRSPCNNLAMSPSSSSVTSVGNAAATSTSAATGATSSFTIGACSDHINGRPQGVDCARCEMLLSSARLNSGVQMSTRNSCKTLKCPQCNWHYKYQETLEIHMREKHPDGESACGYCLAGQQHPRLARGESYSCGYKPYRCEICNYSTTTKGNLSIHMQSDKHLNNMQELNSSQNMVAAAVATGKLLLSSSSSSPQGAGTSNSAPPPVGSSSCLTTNNVVGNPSTSNNSNASSGTVASSSSSVNLKPKPSFRCDICSYETSVARNLRIHMTSEKHTHNMAVLQNNIKHIQTFNFLQQQQQSSASGGVSSSGVAGSFLPEVALADLAYNQALMIQLLHHQQQQQQSSANTKLSPTSSSPDPFNFSISPKPVVKMAHNQVLSLGLGMPIGGGMMETGGDTTGDLPQPISKPNEWPSALYSCLICDSFNTNNLDDLNQHLLVDRSRSQSTATSCSTEIMLIHNNNYICRLCNYKTNLKANFQLHSKTDKHLQKLSYINHIKEGGIRNEYKFQQHFQQQHINVVQLKCNCCDFITNSIQKLSLHTQQMRHDTMRMIFQHLLYILQQSNLKKNDDDSFLDDDQINKKHLVLLCQLCNFSAKNLHEMVQHVKSMRHMQVEQFVCLQRRSENQEVPALNDVFKITEWIYDNDEISYESGVTLARSTTASANERSSLEANSCAVGAPTSASLPSAAVEASSSPSSAPVVGADVGVFSPTTTSPSSCSTSCGKTLGISVTSPTPTVNDFGLMLNIPLSAAAPAPATVSVPAVSVPTTVFKCNLCEYFVQSKSEMETHIETEHPCADPSEDFISIPTNTAALQAFQTAVAAAAIAAVRQQRVSAIEAVTEIKREEDDEEDVEEVSKSIEVTEKKSQAGIQCPLCLENHFREKTSLEMHLTSVHNVARDGLSRLLMLIDPKAWEESKSSISSTEEAMATPEECSSSSSSAAATTNVLGINVLGCQKCEASFKHDEQLLQHAQQTQHFPIQNGEFLCLGVTHISRPCYLRFRTLPIMINHYQDTHMSSVISERHVYKYRCKQCSLAFKTQEKLTTHMLYHTMRDATKCSHCQRNFRSTQALQKHMDQVHAGGEGVRANSSPQAQSQATPTTELPAQEAFAVKGEVAAVNDPMSSPSRFENQQLLAKETSSSRQSPIPSISDTQSQQQYLATLTNLLKQQQCNSEVLAMQPEALLPTGEFSQHLQNLQTIQQQQQQFGTAINPVDMLNLMQFHHLMSLNFMNLAPPLVFGGGGGGGSVVAGATHQNNTNLNSCSSSAADIQHTGSGDSGKATAVVSALTQHNVANSSTQLTASNQKRARTRITDDQLKILRAHFDINNSPSEESIMEMSQKANLPMKVVKHWFRNTLFKERQRNKDSPYNFNNPPSTTLNLEEYERTGQAKVTPLNDTGSGGGSVAIAISTPTTTAISSSNVAPFNSSKEALTNATRTASVSMPIPIPASVSRPESTNSSGNISDYLSQNLWVKEPGKDQNHLPQFPTEMHIKSEPQEIDNNDLVYQKQNQHINFVKLQQQEQPMKNIETDTLIDQTLHTINFPQQQTHLTNNFETKSESGSSDVMSRPPTPNPTGGNNLYGNMNDLINQQLMETMGPPIKKLQISGKNMEKSSTTTSSSTSSTINQSCSQFESNNSSNSSSSSSTSGGKRANRTRFTDYQIKVLQEFFENNSYPKDSDLEYLSKLLLLSPRVIVVWFQNARQKQRKIYENQPNNTLFENEETKKQNINYACKKCSLVFQRYYELIRHQKNHCFKEENNKKSAKAQIAAAQIAQNLSSEDSMDSSMDVHNQNMTAQLAPMPSQHHNLFTKSSSSLHDFSPSTTPTPPQQPIRERSNSLDHPQSQQRHAKSYDCDKCELQFNHLEKLREHQLMHLMNPTKSNLDPNFGPFGSILQSLQQAASQTQSQLQLQPELQSESHSQIRPAKKRKISNDSCSSQAEDDHTTALEKKYDFLHKYFMQNETNGELKQQFLMQQQHNKQSNEHSDFELEFLTNFYQQNELKKVSNYEFLLQYYRNQEDKSSTNLSSTQNPTIEFLLQYYQLNESKKFFQLVASPQRVPDDGPGGNFQPLTGTLEDDKVIKEVHKEAPMAQHDEIILDKKNLENDLEKDWEDEEKHNNNNDAGEKDSLESGSRSRSLQTLQNDDKDKSQYLHNLEDFLDATMIENNSQTLTFNDDNENNASQKDEPMLKTNEIEKISSVSPVNVSSSKQNKRLRTTILPEQLNFLYECYQSESNPSRKMLEEISKKVNLKKRVVQVWFQNSRAKDKKSRNQRHYAHISDENSYDDGGSSSKDNVGQDNNEITNILQDCQLCQVTQVNLQKHAFSVEHIDKMKKFLEQTTSELYGSDDSDSDREKHFYNLSKAFLLQHVVSSAAKSNNATSNIGNSGQDSQPEEDNCLLNYDAKGDDANIPDVRVTEASNQDLMQKLFNRNHITVIGGK
ncbi:zinc finger protein 2 isoform X2 [Drosophila kikkawai]|uniref:Zinc finger protein 2 isoform X2 n=1 Tax=Drosophila kikkawai TaxID=30033 RepID=A0ABM4GM32_DROKI|nr:zinc finger protein 2 isoform X2 [Drosophila kikkawai]